MNLRDHRENKLHPMNSYEDRVKALVDLMQEGARRCSFELEGRPYVPAGPRVPATLSERLWHDPSLVIFAHGVAYAAIYLVDTMVVALQPEKS